MKRRGNASILIQEAYIKTFKIFVHKYCWNNLTFGMNPADVHLKILHFFASFRLEEEAANKKKAEAEAAKKK